MPRIENAGTNVIKWVKLSGEVPSSVDICARCLEISQGEWADGSKTICPPAELMLHNFPGKPGEPEGDFCLETDEDMEEDNCELCDEPLTDEDI